MAGPTTRRSGSSGRGERKCHCLIRGSQIARSALSSNGTRSGDTSAGPNQPGAASGAALLSDRRVTPARLLRLRRNADVTPRRTRLTAPSIFLSMRPLAFFLWVMIPACSLREAYRVQYSLESHCSACFRLGMQGRFLGTAEDLICWIEAAFQIRAVLSLDAPDRREDAFHLPTARKMCIVRGV